MASWQERSDELLATTWSLFDGVRAADAAERAALNQVEQSVGHSRFDEVYAAWEATVADRQTAERKASNAYDAYNAYRESLVV